MPKLQLRAQVDNETNKNLRKLFTYYVNLLQELDSFLNESDIQDGIFIFFNKKGFNPGENIITRSIDEPFKSRVKTLCQDAGISVAQFSEAFFKYVYMKYYEKLQKK